MTTTPEAQPVDLAASARDVVLAAAYPGNDPVTRAMAELDGYRITLGPAGIQRLAALLLQGQQLADAADNLHLDLDALWAQVCEYRLVQHDGHIPTGEDEDQ